jgi:hypothetical protein
MSWRIASYNNVKRRSLLKQFIQYAVCPIKPGPFFFFTNNTKALTEFAPWSRALLEIVTVAQPIKKLPAFGGSQKFITLFTRPMPLISSGARRTQSAHACDGGYTISFPHSPISRKYFSSLPSMLHTPPMSSSLIRRNTLNTVKHSGHALA